MRSKNIHELVTETGYATAQESAREALLSAEGPRAAKWFIKLHRDRWLSRLALARSPRFRPGVLDFTLPRSKELPMHMAFILETLRRRRAWDVREITPSSDSKLRTFRVQWKFARGNA
jgi:hypothetical protein